VEAAKLVFQIHLFTEGLMDTKDERVQELLFVQTVYNVVSGMYPTDRDDVLKLAALQFVAKFGDFKPDSHKPGFLGSKLREFIPMAHLNAGSVSLERASHLSSRRQSCRPVLRRPCQPTALPAAASRPRPRLQPPPAPAPQTTLSVWETELYAKAALLTPATAMKEYVEYLRYRDYFGAVLFGVKQKFQKDVSLLPKRIFLGISRKGILLLRIPTSYTTRTMTTFKCYPLGDIFRWAFKPEEHFYFEVKAEDGGDKPDECKFKTPEGEVMSDLLTDYAMALLREMGLNPDGTKRERTAPEAGAAAASASSAAPAPPQAASLATNTADAYAGVAGDVGALASAATRSGAVDHEAAEEEYEEEEEAGEDVEALPEGWTKQYDEGSERFYYFNAETEESAWERPE